MRKLVLCTAAAVLIAMFCASPAVTQSFTAAIRGVVSDPSGGLISNAKVIVTEADRNVSRTFLTDEAGRYVAPNLAPGFYTLTVEAPGFRRHVQTRFELLVQQQATLDVQMQVGDISTTVEVSGEAPLLNTTMANLGQVIENKYILALPNIARNPMTLTYMTPGVVGSAGRRGDASTNFVANGARNSTSDVMLDGATVTTVEQNSGITDMKYSPSVDAVQEFKIQTNFFSAEYGQTGGAVLNMITKSGTNEFHGTGYYFLRHSEMNSNNWFANRAGRPIPLFRRDQVGGVLGGPIRKNKTFFFTTQEFTRQQNPHEFVSSFPTDLQRAGDFTQTRLGDGRTIQIYNPFDTFRNAAGDMERRPFAGNRIPQSMFDPVIRRVMEYFPRGNQVVDPVTNLNNWFGQGVNRWRNHTMDYKLDHNINDSNRLTGRYSHGRNFGTPPNVFGVGNPAYTFNNGPTAARTHSAVVDFTRTQNPTTVWTARYGLIYQNFSRNPMEPFNLTELGLPNYMRDTAVAHVFPTFAPEGFTDIGTEGWMIMDRQEGVHQFSGSMTKIVGGHNIKVGAEHRRFFLDYLQPGFPSGQFTYSHAVTRQLQNVANIVQGNGLATMLLGWGTGGSFHIEPKAFSRANYWGFYIQDDWKVTRKLTLNLGLRHEFDVPRHEKFNRYSFWDLNAQAPVRAPGLDTRGVFNFTDDRVRSDFVGDYNNLSPRVGFAYALDNKTSIRGGVAILYSLSRATVFGRPGAGFTINSAPVFTLDNHDTLWAKMNDPWPVGMLLPPGRDQGDRTLLGMFGGPTLRQNNRNPEYYSWAFSIQRELPMQSILEVNYVANKGTHLFVPFTNLAPLDPSHWGRGRTALFGMVPNPFFGQITDPRAVNLNQRNAQLFRLLRPMPHFDGAGMGTAEPPEGNSIYHALQMKWEKRMSRGLTMVAHYTWSKMIDDSSISSANTAWLGGSTAMQNPLNRRLERSLSAHDIAHRVVMTGSYQLPVGRGRAFGSGMNRLLDAFLGGWEMSGFLTLQGGNPLMVSQSGGVLWNGTQRPHLLGDPSTTGRVQDRLHGYFNHAMFSLPAPDTFGTAPRYLNQRGPGLRTLDAALLKNWATKEGQRIEFRLELQNATNTPMFGDPVGAFGAPNFGHITGLRIGPREVQLGLKYYF
jgi:hypothetical protein